MESNAYAVCQNANEFDIFPRTAVLFLVKARTTLAYDWLKLLDLTVTQNQDHSCPKLDRIRFSKDQGRRNWAVPPTPNFPQYRKKDRNRNHTA